MIPKIIHNIWIQGYDNLSEKNKENYNKNKKLNPGWRFIFWDEPMIIELLKKYPKIHNIYNNVENLSYTFKINIYAIKSDISRYMILKECGGLYIDFECISSFIDLFNEDDTVYTISSKISLLYLYPFSKPIYCSCFIALEKNHPIWNNVINIMLHAKTQYEIGSAFDISLQKGNYNIVLLNEINGAYTCNNNTICSTPSESSWNISRPFLKYINCYSMKILYTLIILITFIIIYMNRNLFTIQNSIIKIKKYKK